MKIHLRPKGLAGLVFIIGSLIITSALCEKLVVTKLASTSVRSQMVLGMNQNLHESLPVISTTARAALNSSAGGKVTRFPLQWARIERVKGVYDWSTIDSAVSAAQAHKLDIVIPIVGSPTWLNGSSDDTVVPTNPAAISAWVTAYRTFIRLAVTRYHTSVKKWELWNESNIIDFWKPLPDAAIYLQWAVPIYADMKAIDTSLQIVICTANANWGAGSTYLKGVEFVQTVYIGGFYADGLSIHPYSRGRLKNTPPPNQNTNASSFSDIALMRSLMVTNGHENDQLWVTEFGWASASSSDVTTPMTPSIQASDVTMSLEILKDRHPYVSIALIFLDFDDGTEWQYYGLYDSTGAKKEAARAFSKFIQLYSGP